MALLSLVLLAFTGYPLSSRGQPQTVVSTSQTPVAYAGSYATAPRTDQRKRISPKAAAVAKQLALLSMQKFGLTAVDTPAKMRDWILARAATALDAATTEQIERFSAAMWEKNDGAVTEADLQAPPGGAPKLCDAFASEVYDEMVRQLGSAATAQRASVLANTVALQLRQELCPGLQLLLVTRPPATTQSPTPTTPGAPTPTTPGRTNPHSDMVIYLVRTGDSLWSIAAARLPASSSTASIESAWRRIWTTNRAVIGPYPDVILPGQKLLLGTTPAR